ncbi:hypothetical protein D3C79_797540 [compost metagenome]
MPILQAIGPPASGNTAVSRCVASGTSAEPNNGTPILTEMAPVAVRSHVSKPRLVCSVIERVFASLISLCAAPRVALPQTSSVEPSAFQNISRASASWQSSTTAS